MTHPTYTIIGLSLLLASSVQAQMPTPILYEGALQPPTFERGACNEAGTVNVSLTGGSQSNSPLFLCWEDSLVITHNGNQDLSGDPNPSTTPGIGYGFYDCPPTIGGMTIADILLDPCIIDVPAPPTGLWITTGPNPNGNAVFHNDGFLQRFFNNGDPVQIWFTPITIDNFANNTYEEATPGGGAGPCVSANTTGAFSVVYLNRIDVSNLNTSWYGASPSTGSFVITGGRPEFDGTFYTINIYQRSNPLITATITSPAATHGSTVTFEVPNDREYVVEIEDGTGCSTSFFVTVPSLVVEMNCIEVDPGGTGCIQAVVRNYTGVEALQLFFHYDPAVVTFNSVSSPSLLNWSPASGASVNGDSILTISHSIFPGETLVSGTILFSICFTAVGNVGDCSPIILKNRWDGAKNEAIIGIGGGNDAQVAISSLDGCVCIVEPGEIKLTLTPTSLSCAGAADGMVRMDVNGGTPPYTYSWAHATNPGYQGTGVLAFNPSTFTLTNLIPGIYSVTITDSEGIANVVTRQILVESPSPIVINMDFGNPTCFGDTDGYLFANVLGGTPPLTFDWSSGQSGVGLDVISGLPAATYIVTVTDVNGCTQVATQILGTPQLQVNVVSQQNVTCAGGINSGSVTVSATGGTLPTGSAYQYNWGSSGMGSSLTSIPAGTYSVTVTDDNNCTASLNITITAPASPVIDTMIVTDAGCETKANGTITAQVTPAPGATNLTYSWTGPNNTIFSGAQITGLLPGNYFLTVTDDNGCADVGIVYVSFELPFIVVDTFQTLPSCPGFANGSLGLQIIGGTMPYSFTWSNIGTPSPNSVIPAIPAGSYSVTITDAEGCGPVILDLVLSEPPAIVATFSGIDSVSCEQGVCDGTATALASYTNGNAGLFTFSWASTELDIQVASSTATMLCSGLQTLTISDGNCSIDTSVFVPSPAPIIVSAVATDISCFGLTDGAIAVNVAGGSPAFQYIWAFGDTTLLNSQSNLGLGFYQVTVVDQNGCLGLSNLVEISQPTLFTLALDPDRTRNERCAGEANGTIGVTYTGGNPGSPNYQWSAPGASGSLAANLAAGTYSITATDSRGCTDTITHTLVAPPVIQGVLAPLVEPLCFGETTLLNVSSANGGNGPQFTYSVDNGPIQPVGNPIAIFAGQDILVSVFDALGCKWDTLVNVDQPPPLVLDLGPDIELELGDSTMLSPVNNLGGFTIISYLWNPVTGLSCTTCDRVTATPQGTTTYSLRIEDINGCDAEDEVTINVLTIRRVYVPTAFSPNFDGFNDNMTVHIGKGVDHVGQIQIFDRWGNQVYEQLDLVIPSDGTIIGWDGHFRGKMMDPGAYVYVVTVRFLDGQELIYRGDLNLIR